MPKLAKIYVDGYAGTTGLRIHQWLSGRTDLELLTLPPAQRKDPGARRDSILSADIAILCLPDDAAREAAQWVKTQHSDCRIIDASTAHRVADDWIYGLPELAPEQRRLIANARRVSNPGCYSSASILLLRPLIDAQLLLPECAVVIHALSGYSGGGRNMIEKWESAENGLSSQTYPAPYALDRAHKHIPEMMAYTGLTIEPQFIPAVGAFRCGMRVEIALHSSLFNGDCNGQNVRDVLTRRYSGERFVKLRPPHSNETMSETFLNPQVHNDTNTISLDVVSHPSGHVLLVALLDNLGKGASGMAVQSLNLMLGVEEEKGLPG